MDWEISGGWQRGLGRAYLLWRDGGSAPDGYATSSRDTGHTGNGGDASFALGHPEKLIDFAYRSVHEMALKTKAIIEAFYGTPARHSYWYGCSTGGRQGLVEAQRFPGDFDGIVGAPAFNQPRLTGDLPEEMP